MGGYKNKEERQRERERGRERESERETEAERERERQREAEYIKEGRGRQKEKHEEREREGEREGEREERGHAHLRDPAGVMLITAHSLTVMTQVLLHIIHTPMTIQAESRTAVLPPALPGPDLAQMRPNLLVWASPLSNFPLPSPTQIP